MRPALLSVCLGIAIFGGAAPFATKAQMPNPKEMSGIPRPDTTVPVGTVSVRVIRGSFDKDIPNQPVEFTIDGTARVVNTGADGRALVKDVRKGASVVVATTVDGERLESRSFTMSSTGILLALVAADPEAVARASEDKSLAAAPATKGIVVLGPESRVIVELGEDGLTIFYIMDVLNTARTPVDIGGPLIFDLPQGARGASILPDSSPQGSANGPRIIVTGPFKPGSTVVQAAFELPYRGPTVQVDQVWPATLQQLILLVEKHGALEIASPQIAARAVMSTQGGKEFINATGPALQTGQRLTLDISGLPHHSVWPRWVALALAGCFITWGLWAAMTSPARRRV